MKRKCHFVLFVILTLATCGYSSLFKVRYQWKYIDYVWKNADHKRTAVARGEYNRSANVPYDTQLAPDGRHFVTIVRTPGVPATLTTISGKMGNGGPLLKPFPNWDWNTLNSCDNIVSVYRVMISCDTLWLVDNGKNGEDQVCPPKVLAFDLFTNKLVRRIRIPRRIANNAQGTGLLVNILVYNPRCEWSTPKFYIPDVEGFGLVVYNGKSLKRLESDTFNGEAAFSSFSLQGGSFILQDGILPVALKCGKNPELYWRALAGDSLHYAKLRDIDNANQVLPKNVITSINGIGFRSAAMTMTDCGDLIYAELENYAISYWNTALNYTSNTHRIEKNETTLQFATNMKIVDDKIYVITNRLQTFSTGNENLNEVNFRILNCPVTKALRRKN